jgi:hypothetical protein
MHEPVRSYPVDLSAVKFYLTFQTASFFNLPCPNKEILCPLTYLLRINKDFHATDQRDRIYALLGILGVNVLDFRFRTAPPTKRYWKRLFVGP